MANQHHIKIVTVEEMVAVEKAANEAGHSYRAMMEHAGRALADHLLWTLSDQMSEPRFLVLVGAGNNGGDGLVAARCLMEDLGDAEIAAYLTKSRDDDLLQQAKDAGVEVILAEDDAKNDYAQLNEWLDGAGIIVDAILGTGAKLPVKGTAATVLKKVQERLAARADLHLMLHDPTQPLYISDDPVIVAVDCPSGLDCNTGELDPVALKADSTVTFAAAKLGHFIFPGAAAVGHLRVGEIGLPDKIKGMTSIKLRLADGAWVGQILPKRSINSHKGTFGKTMIVAGSSNYTGAAYLAGAAAYRIGTGLVTIAAPQTIIPILASLLPEATWVLMPHEMGVLNEGAVSILRKSLEGYTALLVGPGLSQDEATQKFIDALFSPTQVKAPKSHIGFRMPGAEEAEATQETVDLQLPPLVIDADGLNLLAKMEKWWTRLPKDTILTPHPTEFARLAGIEEKDGVSASQQVQADRIALALKYAKKWGCVVVLKGAFTVVAQSNGQATLIPFATSALATAGTGDVLAGTIAGLLAQGIAPADAAIAGTWLHGFAGTQAEAAQGIAAGVIARDVLANLVVAVRTAQTAANG